MPGLLWRTAVAVGLTATFTSLGTARASWACGCGAVVAPSGSQVSVPQETSIVRVNGGREQIVMQLAMSSAARNVAWLMPTPSPADVTLGDPDWFSELDAAAAPKIVYHYYLFPHIHLGGGSSGVGAAPGGPQAGAGTGVDVLRQQRLGPFQVATIKATDTAALASWLSGHGYHLPGNLATALRPYAARDWSYTAVKLTAAGGGALTGTLTPLSLSFPAQQPVYPMRLSRLATERQALHLYILAPHRVRILGGPPLGTLYAGWVTPDQFAAPGLRQLTGGRVFLTDLSATGITPASISSDLGLVRTPDTLYQRVTVQQKLATFAGIPVLAWLVLLVILAVTAFAISLARRGRKRRSPRISW